MAKIVVNGATGMIAVSLIKTALDKGDEVYAIARKNSHRVDNIPSGAKVVFCDLSELIALKPDFSADIFFHLAWDKTGAGGRDDVDVQLKNVEYTLDAVRLAKKLGCKKFVGAGSQAEYGITDKPLTPNSMLNPSSGYGVAKMCAGKMSKLLASQLGISHSWARILSVFGENDAPTTLISYLIDTFKKGERAELTKCEQTWDYVYADDCALALYLIGKNGVDGKSYPIGSGKPRKLSEFVTVVRDKVNKNAEICFGAKDYYPHQPMFLCADITELTEDTGFVPQYSFEEGINKTLGATNGKS